MLPVAGRAADCVQLSDKLTFEVAVVAHFQRAARSGRGNLFGCGKEIRGKLGNQRVSCRISPLVLDNCLEYIDERLPGEVVVHWLIPGVEI